MTVELPGFKRLVRAEVQVHVSETVEVNVPMDVSGVVESAQVGPHTPVLETAQASLGPVI